MKQNGRVDIDALLQRDVVQVHTTGAQSAPETIPVRAALLGQGESLLQQLQEAAAWYGWLGERSARVGQVLARVERQKNELFNELANEAREGLAREGKVTEKAIEQAVRQHPDYIAVCQICIDQQYEHDAITKILRAAELRIDCLKTIQRELARSAGKESA